MNGQIPGMAGALCGQGLQRHLNLGKAETGAPHKAVGTPAEWAPWSASRSADKPAETKFSTASQYSQGNWLLYCIFSLTVQYYPKDAYNE